MLGMLSNVASGRVARDMKDQAGRVALVMRGGEGPYRATALALAARGMRVVVAGGAEKGLGETVGEIAYGGGKARHVAGDAAAAIARALEVFGGLDVAIAPDEADLAAVRERTNERAQLVRVQAGEPAADARWAAVGFGPGVEDEDVAELVVWICGRRLNGRAIALR